MGEVHQHAFFFHAAQHHLAKGGQAALLTPMGRTAQVITAQVHQPGRAHAGIIKSVQVLQAPFEAVQPFHAQEARRQVRILLASREESVQLRHRLDNMKQALRAGLQVAQHVRRMHNTFKGAAQRFFWPPFNSEQIGHGIQFQGNPGDARAHRRQRGNGEELKRYISFPQSRQVHMPASAPDQQIAVGEQGVTMHIHHRHLLMCRFGFGTDPVRLSHQCPVYHAEPKIRQKRRTGNAWPGVGQICGALRFHTVTFLYLI
ncbi:MAG: hypothetical protein BWX80_04054 [Candidatus Hydrogenedentes bacterium ADurb.Bin101]|nr:MAG: hypothetical protein BWX80_04054 [Candidatus Hydrogenedentes bacterium ADurb.Bin101]